MTALLEYFNCLCRKEDLLNTHKLPCFVHIGQQLEKEDLLNVHKLPCFVHIGWQLELNKSTLQKSSIKSIFLYMHAICKIKHLLFAYKVLSFACTILAFYVHVSCLMSFHIPLIRMLYCKYNKCNRLGM